MADLQCVDFYGHDLYTIRDERNGKDYVLPKRFCEIFKLAWAPQYVKLTKNQLFRQGVTKIVIPSAQGEQETIILELDLLHAWLLSISPERVAPDLREMLLTYQRECAQALRDYWMKGVALNPRAEQVSHSFSDAKAQLSLIDQAHALLIKLGQLTARDTLMLADQARNVMQRGQRLLTAPSESNASSPSQHGFSIAERVEQLGYVLTRKEQAALYPQLGKRVAEEWRRRFEGEQPKETRWVDGAQRKVAWYAEEDASWIDPILQSLLANFSWISRDASREE